MHTVPIWTTFQQSRASFTMMGMFGMNRSLRGAMAGHYAAYEMTSSLPNKFLGDGFRRLGYGADVIDYFDEHVEADAVHEQIAGRDLAGGLAEQEPRLLADIMFGANTSLIVDGLAGEDTLSAWKANRSALRNPKPDQEIGRASCRERVQRWRGAGARYN